MSFFNGLWEGSSVNSVVVADVKSNVESGCSNDVYLKHVGKNHVALITL